MRLLYGVVGEGMGHAMRSRVILEHLIGAGHEIEIMVSGRAQEYLAKRFAGVNRIHGMHLITDENRIRVGKTLWTNVLAGVTGVPSNIAAYFDLFRTFRPEAVISDFESWTYLYAKTHRLPILSVDNMQIINRCNHPADILEGVEPSFRLAKAFVKGKLPFCSEYFITTFFKPEIRKPDTRLFPPIVRPEIQAAKPTRGGHLLVYQTAEGFQKLAEILEKTGIECRIYGMRRGLSEDVVEKNLRYRPFSEEVFIQDLASARAVIAAGGFTLMSECVYLKKPMLSVPIEKQFEQVMNARYLARLGYGMSSPTLEDPHVIESFLTSVDTFANNLASYDQDGNREIFQAIDGFLDKAAAGVA